ncbi:general transcription factor 3C polypeptide 2 isoform X1 [Parus major]|uniref:general transcription factor 3C polypeptide 2 isoform X1 n=1 Tax=Parus major TaxID=9157 RepID=UPI00077151D2|nr:general transcription factor 3C polypeptide 2 isoform X1 [Parus major]
MASSTARRPPCRERSLRERPGQRSGSAGRNRSRSGEREGEPRVLREELPAGDRDCEDGEEAAESPEKPVRPQVSPAGAAPGPGESSANGAVPAARAAGRRGRKGKAEVLLLELSRAPEPVRMEKRLGSSEDGLETPRGGRPKRKAAKVECVWIQEPLAGGSSCLWQEEFPWFLTEQEELIGGSRASSREFRVRGGRVLRASGTAGADSLPRPRAGRGEAGLAHPCVILLLTSRHCPAVPGLCCTCRSWRRSWRPRASPPCRPRGRRSQSTSRGSAGAGGGRRRTRTAMTPHKMLTSCPHRKGCRQRRRRRRAATRCSVRCRSQSWRHLEGTAGGRQPQGSKPQCRGLAPNGFHNSIMAPVEKSSSLTCSLREQKHSQWEFPDWIPVAHRWTCLSDSEAAPYLPAEEKSPLFSIQREGIKDDGALYRLNRFSSLPPHPERLDVSFFVGGPVWAMEWCPTPEGSAAPQYVAVSCHRSMEETHSVSGLHSGPALLQLWGLGMLQTEQGSPNKARLAYAIAADYGCVWDMKFCPSGAWEPPTAARTHPQMSRLGLLAAAFSDGRVVVYALPHPGALHHAKTTQVKDGSLHKHLICKVQCIATLQVGSIEAGNATECGQCFSLSWMPSKPHHHLAAGFYDGTVAVWNLLTKSLLQCVHQPDASLKLYPFRCFLAHDHAVRSIEWCKADSNFLVTVGSDRKIKFWDLRRLYEPINSIKRFLSTEVAWLLPYNGITVAQDNCYASYGVCGIHYIDAGYLGFKAYFVAPRKGTVWSISGSDWLNTVAAGDITGELVAAVLPDLAVNPLNVKRSSDRRFPVYKADLLPCSPDGPECAEQALPRTHRYSEMVARSYIRFQDTDLRSFQNFPSREPMRRMHKQELKAELSLDRLQLEALHKVRFSPNLDSQGWLVSGGQAGIVRAHCLVGLASGVGHQLLPECQARFSVLYGDTASSPGPPEHSLLPAE